MPRDRESKGFRLPAGVAEKQRIEALELKVKELERRLKALEEGEEATPEREALIEEALALKVLAPNGKPASRSILDRWKTERLTEAIAEAKG